MAGLPTLLDVIEARGRIARHIVRTPLHHYTALDRLIGAEVYVKHENHQLLGSFKMRGALNVVSQLPDEQKKRGAICASTGNFGQGIAYAAKQFGLDASVAMPEDANPDKVESMRRLGAQIIFHGKDFDDAREHSERLAREEGYYYVHSANDPGPGARRGDLFARDHGGPARRGRHNRARGRRQRGMRRIRRRQGPESPRASNRGAVGAGQRGVPLVEGGPGRRVANGYEGGGTSRRAQATSTPSPSCAS